MILYRGSPEPETNPKPRSYAAAFFAPDFKYAAQYGPYVQEYQVGRQRILDFGDPKARKLVFQFTGHQPSRDSNDEVMLDLFWHPTKAWARFVMKAGYTATAMGWNIAIFDVSKVELREQWQIEWEGGKVRIHRLL